MSVSTKVFVERMPWNDSTKIWVTSRGEDGRRFNYTIGKEGFLLATVVKEGEMAPNPLMILPFEFVDQFVDALIEKIPPVKKEVVESELNATKYHLEDMRKLVFKAK